MGYYAYMTRQEFVKSKRDEVLKLASVLRVPVHVQASADETAEKYFRTKLKNDNPAGYSMGYRNKVFLALGDGYVGWLHEICHYMASSPANRRFVNYGLMARTRSHRDDDPAQIEEVKTCKIQFFLMAKILQWPQEVVHGCVDEYCFTYSAIGIYCRLGRQYLESYAKEKRIGLDKVIGLV